MMEISRHKMDERMRGKDEDEALSSYYTNPGSPSQKERVFAM